jgi:hypothetical protein
MADYAWAYYAEDEEAYMHELIHADGQFEDGLGTKQETQGEGFYTDGVPLCGDPLVDAMPMFDDAEAGADVGIDTTYGAPTKLLMVIEDDPNNSVLPSWLRGHKSIKADLKHDASTFALSETGRGQWPRMRRHFPIWEEATSHERGHMYKFHGTQKQGYSKLKREIHRQRSLRPME